MAVRNIIKLGDETLRKKCRKVDTINDRIKTLVSDIADTLHSADDGIGLAAPQVGVLRRVVVIDMGNGVKTYINPEIISSQGSRKVIESCPEYSGRIRNIN